MLNFLHHFFQLYPQNKLKAKKNLKGHQGQICPSMQKTIYLSIYTIYIALLAEGKAMNPRLCLVPKVKGMSRKGRGSCERL